MKVPLLAISAMIVLTACNREGKRDTDAAEAARNDTQSMSENARQEGREMGNEAAGAADRAGDKAAEEARQSGRDVKEGSKEAASKVKEEARQTGRDIKEGANAAGAKVGEEARQASRAVKGMLEGDNAATAKDKEIITRIRAAWSKDAEAAKESDDVDIAVDKGAVVLKGTVTSTDTRKEMARIAKKESGVTKVTNEIKLAERVGAGSGD